MAKTFNLVAEGDSWFKLPDFPVKLPIVGGPDHDLIRALSARGHKIDNLAYWGDTIAEIARRAEFMTTIRGRLRAGHKVDGLLLSGGGNDLLGNGRLAGFLKVPSVAGTSVDDYVAWPAFSGALGAVVKAYKSVLRTLASDPDTAGLKVIGHGYDYASPMKLIWLEQPMDHVGVPTPELKRAIVVALINRVNAALRRIAKSDGRFVLVDLRDTVKGRWHDELHPTKAGFKDCAAKIDAALQATL